MSTRDRLDEIEEQLREYARWLQVELRKTERAINALAATDDDEDDGGQSLSDLVLHILREANGRIMTIQDVYSEARRRGWDSESKDPVNVVRAALARLTQSGELLRSDKRGTYRIRESTPDAVDRISAERAARLAAVAKAEAAVDAATHAKAEAASRAEDDRNAQMRARLEHRLAEKQKAEALAAAQAERKRLALARQRGSEEKEPQFVRPHTVRDDEPPF